MLNAASGEVRIHMMVDLCQRVLDGLGMSTEWAINSVVVPLLKITDNHLQTMKSCVYVFIYMSAKTTILTR